MSRPTGCLRALCVVVCVAAAAGCNAGEQTGSSGEASFETVTGDGAWCWFADPRAIHDTTAVKTYVGWVDSTAGAVSIRSYDHERGNRTTATLAGLHRDDHANPALLLRPSGHLMAFYSAHNGGKMYYRRTSRPHDISAWEAERTVDVNTEGDNGYTYPNPVQLSAENDRIYLFWRGGNWQPNFSVSDSMNAWSEVRTLLRVPGERPYIKYASNGVDRIDFAFTDGHPLRIENNNIYYGRYRESAFHTADGHQFSAIADLPLDISETDLVYDAGAHGARAWIWDVAIDSAGVPVIVFSTLYSRDDHRYRYATWTPEGWEHHLITKAGGAIDGPSEPYYSGGVALDHENPSTVYLSREVDGAYEIERWRTGDGGESWQHDAITNNSDVKNVRPVAVRHRRGDSWQVLWMRGTYDHYTDYQTAIERYP